ncbi:aminopeptidase P family protein [Tessaracoccus flavus]|uniref:Xaa-Pro aminopeptidase n=1 Tax=Tessaracoccus flavus TaxID=1610493 RepID=A0A1Q2CG70_9ACTN|nr:aminopeptidase P family protein [Tessaracoccus flavus]AQP45097.1 Xaa-Pro aminopeptidase [Tessaracoccus flavus]SDY56554.1 Xaa-Pro aminopeptidase [Tessaracoccus flavus]
MTESPDASSNRRDPYSEAFKKFIVADWAPYSDDLPERLPAADHTPARREKLAAEFPGKTLVIPAGPLKVRSNDTDYRFRPHTAFAYYTGLGEDREPDAVLVIRDEQSTLFFRPRAPRTDREFYADPRYGEVWVGQRDSLEELQSAVGFECRAISELPSVLSEAGQSLLVIREADPSVTAIVDEARGDQTTALDGDLERCVSEARFIKDDFEVAEMRRACDATRTGFEAVARELPNAVANGRGERWVEGIFGLHARHLGNAVGYDTISAGGDHANTLHWIRNDGDLRDGDLLLLDAGVEVNSLYTADITRTMPVGGTFSEPQRRVYDAVLAAQTAGIEACRDGNLFADVHRAAITVLAHFFEELGILPCTAEESLAEEGGFHRRWMVHGTSHHLGLDVHDCARAKMENYRLGTLHSGMIITVEPGIYFKSTDLLVPEEYRGIGIRIEDDILITDGDPVNLSEALPREAEAVEAWLADLQK